MRVAAAHLVLAADRISPLRSKGSFGLCEARARRLKRRALDTLRTTMAAHVDLRVHFDEDWTGGKFWLPLGVLQGFVTLRIAGRLIIDFGVYAMNPSAVSLLRTLESDHDAASPDTSDDAQWPLFFCCASLWNRCGIITDFTVHREGDRAVFTDFLRCEVPATAVLRVPWISWAIATERLGRAVLRRCPIVKKGVSRRYQKRYGVLRDELKRLLTIARKSKASNTYEASSRQEVKKPPRRGRRRR